MGDIIHLPEPSLAIQDRLTEQLARRFGPGWDPVLRIAEIAEDTDWPRSLRLDALKTVAKYVRPQFQSVPSQESSEQQHPVIVIVDHTATSPGQNAPPGLRAMKPPLHGEIISDADCETVPSEAPARESSKDPWNDIFQ